MLGDIRLWVGVPRASSALAVPLPARAHAPVDVMNKNMLSQPTLSLSSVVKGGWEGSERGFRVERFQA